MPLDDDDADADADVLVYELDDWAPDERASLDALLKERGISHTWEGTDLVTSGAAEDEIDALLDSLEFPDALEDDEEDDGEGESGYEVMSDLFVVADRAAGERTIEASLAVDLGAAASAALEIGAPYGIEDATWNRVRKLAEEIVAALDSDGDDQVVIEMAAGLRNLLRTLV